MRGRFFRRIGCAFVLLLLLAFGGFTVLFWLIASASSLVEIPANVLAVMRTAGIAFVLLGLASLIFGGRELRRTALPIGDMLEASGRIAEGDYDVRVDERGPREVRALVRAFNTMAARLQADARQRRDLLADISHELRTPITVIQGHLEGLLDGIYPANPEHIAAILEETQTLSRVIDDLRMLSYADSGMLPLQREPTNLAALVEESAAAFKVQAGAAGVEVDVANEGGLPEIEIDPTRVREVLANLLANALRYTPEGGRIEVLTNMKTGGGYVEATVRDSGAGISAEDLPHIFDRFYKAADSPGTGLGLAIARSLVAAHGGEISAESEPGVGTTIRFTLPVKVPEESA